jgi:hypothetical protein
VKLPNAGQAVVAEDKIVRYLLNEAHPRGKDKAAFFSRFGFSVAKWEVLAAALLAHAAAHGVTSTLETREGTHYAVDGPLSTPDGRHPQVRTIWAVDTGSEIPRFITAYPLKQKGG